MNIVFNFTRTAALLGAVLIAAGSCSVTAGAPSGGVSLVASTSVWGSVAELVAGRLAGSAVTITSIVHDPAADPHSYEVSTRDELAVARADVVVENGGGYDDFVGQLRSASGATGALLDAVRIAGRRVAHHDPNEHVWYDFPIVGAVAGRMADALASADPVHAGTYRHNAGVLGAKLAVLEHREALLGERFRGTSVAITEPVPLYMLTACGLVDRTPRAFSAAIEGEQEVPVRVVQQMRDLLAGHAPHPARVLVYNAQTSGPQTSQVIDAAEKAGVPVVPVTETLPAGATYLGWMTANLEAVGRALEAGTR